MSSAPLLILGNPKRRRKVKAKSAKKKHHRKHHSSGGFSITAARNPAPKRRRKRKGGFGLFAKRNPKRKIRRNPISGGGGSLESQAMGALEPAVLGAVGAVGAGMVMRYVTPKLPANLQTGLIGQVVKAGVVLGLGALGGQVLPRNLAHAATVGALTVVAYNTLVGLMAQSNVQMGAQVAAVRRPAAVRTARNALAPPNALNTPNALGAQVAGMPGHMNTNANALNTMNGLPAPHPQRFRSTAAFGAHVAA